MRLKKSFFFPHVLIVLAIAEPHDDTSEIEKKKKKFSVSQQKIENLLFFKAALNSDAVYIYYIVNSWFFRLL